MRNVVIFLVLIQFQSFSQKSVYNEIDSLQKSLISAHDTDKFDIYLFLIYHYQNINMDTTELYLRKALECARKTKNIANEAKAIHDFGTLSGYNFKYSEALKYYFKSIKLYEKAGEFKSIILVYHDLGNLYWTQTNYAKATEYYLKELEFSEKYKDSFGMARSLNSLAVLYGKSDDFKEELRYYFRALDIWTKLKSKKGISTVLLNIGNSYKGQGMYNEALKYYQKSLYYVSYEHIRFSDILYYNLGDIYFELGVTDSSNFYFRKALSISVKFGNNYTLAYINMGLAKLFNIKKQQDSTFLYLTLAMKNANISQTPDCLKLIYKEFAKYYASVNDFKQAYLYFDKYENLQDSLSPSEARQKIAAYETEKVKSKLKILEKEKEIVKLKTERSKNQRNYLAILSLLILAITLIVYNRYRFRKKANALLELKNNELELANNTKDKFFAIIAHDLKNYLVAFQTVGQNLSENYELMDDARKKHLITRLWQSSQVFFRMMENLLTWSMSQLKRIDFEPEKADLKNIGDMVISELQLTASRKQITIENFIPEETLAVIDVNMIHNVFRNLLINSIKFSKENSIISIKAAIKTDYVVISVEDHGIGITADDIGKLFRIDADHKTIGSSKEKGTGLGLILCKEFISKHNGEIWVESKENEGSTFYFNLPINGIEHG